MSYTVTVSNIAPATTEQHLHDFFTFCGKIVSIEHDPVSNSATINFEKSSAAKTALMLNGGTLDGSHLSVTSAVVHVDEEHTDHHDGTFEQSDKPRAGIAAEYLARGYTLSDHILQRAIELDQKQGISNRFLSYISSLDTTLGEKTLGRKQTISGKVQETLTNAAQQARTVDAQKGYSKHVGDYYSRALASPLGKKVFEFYTTTSKQILDIHEEAKRIAETQKTSGHTDAHAAAAPSAEAPTVAPGSAGAGITGAEVKKTDAPTVV